MHYFIAALIASASLAAALPGSPIPSASSGTTVEPTATASPPIDFDTAKQLFGNTNNLPANPKVVPFLVEPKFSIQQTTSTAPPSKPTVVSAKVPDLSKNVVSSPPGIPKTGAIQIQPSTNIPLSSVIGQNQSHPIDRIPLLNSRQACESYPYCCPDPRYLNENTAFPYSVIGRHWNNGLGCTGTLVGPRHVLTASHCISWSGCFDSYNGAPQFAVDYWPGHAPAIFYGEAVYHYDASACGDPSTLVQEGIDYVVVILSEETGLPYMGIKAYDTAWNGPKYWYQQGYAADAGGTMYPYVQGPFSVVNEFSEGFGDILEYAACDTPGDSGSPVWSWWEDGPYIVGLMTEVGSQLGANAGWGPAGQALVNLVSQARSLYP